jgi:NAD(P)-dependent dehydrogenase (short-subunit alcohol dehydrogenase family)
LPRAQAVVADVTSEADCVRMIDAAAAFGPLDIVVPNAGTAESAPAGRTDRALWQRMLDVNLTGAFLTVRAALPQLTRGDVRPGQARRIVFVASMAGLQGFAYVSAYCAAKHGVIGLMRALSVELSRFGVTVNAVCPGYTETPMFDASLDVIAGTTGRSRESAKAMLAAANPGGRLVSPEEVAEAVRDLCRPDAVAITGRAIPIPEGPV